MTEAESSIWYKKLTEAKTKLEESLNWLNAEFSYKKDPKIEATCEDFQSLTLLVLKIRNTAIKVDIELGLTYRDVANKYNLSPIQIKQIVNG